LTSTSILPMAWAASVWTTAPARWAWAAMSPTGRIAPVSFCASIIVSRATSGPSAAAAVATSIEPV